jgi:ABC-type spermidine/putrescine transport system permease subunit II
VRNSVRRGHPIPRAIAAVAFLLLYGPIVVVAINSFNSDANLVHWGGGTLHWFDLALRDPVVLAAIRSSLRIAVVSSVGSIVIAICSALYWRRSGPRARQLLDATTYLRIALPEAVSALALFLFFRRLNVTLGTETIVIGHIVFNSAYATIVLQARLAGVSDLLETAAADLGARPYRAFLRVTLPVMRPAIIAAAFLTFALSLDDVVTSSFLAGSGTQTLPMVVLGMIRYRTSPEVNAIGVAMTVITVSMLGIGIAAFGLRGTFGSPLRSRKRSV